jgi:hypothetical protein
LARVRLNKNWGYIDKTGEVVIRPRFLAARDFRKGLSPVRLYAE